MEIEEDQIWKIALVSVANQRSESFNCGKSGATYGSHLL